MKTKKAEKVSRMSIENISKMYIQEHKVIKLNSLFFSLLINSILSGKKNKQNKQKKNLLEINIDCSKNYETHLTE